MRSVPLVIITFAVLTLAFPSAAKDWTTSSKAGDGSVFTFRGSKIGDSIEKKFAGVAMRYDAQGSYCRVAEFGETVCYDRSTLRTAGEGRNIGPKLFIGDVEVSVIAYYYLDGKLYQILVLFREPNFSNLANMLEGKYGPPNKSSSPAVRNRAGAAFNNPTKIWNTPVGDLVVEARTTDINTGSIGLTSAKPAAELRSRKLKDAQSKGKSAF